MLSVFVDSTTLIYPLDRTEPGKARQALEWLRRLRIGSHLVISPQVLNETYWTGSRKAHLARPRDALRTYVSAHAAWATAPLNSSVLQSAWELQDRYLVGFWDALLLASANSAGCDLFLSEDLNAGQLYGRVKVVNPFLTDPDEILGALTH